MTRTNRELKLIFVLIVALFAAFLAGPILVLLGKSLWDGGLTGEFYISVLSQDGFLTALGNSFAVAAASAAAAALLAFLMAYAVHYTRLPQWAKSLIRAVATLPMFLPTITYGFAIIYSFGKQGLLTRLLGRQLFDIYGFGGLMVGYVIYTIPVAFLLIHNTMGFVDKKTLTVSKVMGDKTLATFWIAVLRPLLGTLAGAFIQAFFLCFTDFGIPASVGGGYEVIATLLYNQMLGGIPDFNRGAVIAMVMLIPSIGSICILQILERLNIRCRPAKKHPAGRGLGAVQHRHFRSCPVHLCGHLCGAPGGGVALPDRVLPGALPDSLLRQQPAGGLRPLSAHGSAHRGSGHPGGLRCGSHHSPQHSGTRV